MEKLYVVGKVSSEEDYLEWAFQGVFDNLSDAIKACKTDLYFIGPSILNSERPEEDKPWPFSWYPLREDKPKIDWEWLERDVD